MDDLQFYVLLTVFQSYQDDVWMIISFVFFSFFFFAFAEES